MNPFWIILLLILLALALPPAIKKKSWAWFFIALILSFVVVVLPLFVFLFSSFMVPEWKGACSYDWLNCFIVGKLALTPFVLVAIAALYSVEILRVEKRAKRWIVVGIFLGAVVATVCLVFGLVCIGCERMMLVPFYVAVWYSIRAIQLIGAAGFSFWTYFGALLGSLPFWLASWVWSRSVYESLPDKAPSGCFVVTAASHGHVKCVGPFAEIMRNGRRLRANQQLITLWQFEALWHARAPRCHATFRRIYNRIGPVIAGQIRSPWLADVTCLALKPAEITARLINRKFKE